MKHSVNPFLIALAAGQTRRVDAQLPGTFAATGSLITARARHTATLLKNGKVFITGGSGSTERAWIAAPAARLADGTVLTGSELYHPARLVTEKQ